MGKLQGRKRIVQGKPFVGRSGQLLDRMLHKIGLSRDTVYISNIVPWRPPGNRTPNSQEIALCQPLIQRHIELVSPQILIAVGGVAASTLFEDKRGIMRLRGKWLPYQSPGLSQPIDGLAMFHPAYLLRSPGQKVWVWHDLLMIKQRLRETAR